MCEARWFIDDITLVVTYVIPDARSALIGDPLSFLERLNSPNKPTELDPRLRGGDVASQLIFKQRGSCGCQIFAH